MSSENEKLLLEFDIARQNRRFEIEMFWQRANYFLVLNTALAVGAYSVDSKQLALFISAFGALAAFLWFKTNLGAKYWQSFWEAEVHKLAAQLQMGALSLSDSEIYRNSHILESDEDTTPTKRWLNKRIRNNPSVSSNMIWLSVWTLAAWNLLIIYFLSDIFRLQSILLNLLQSNICKN